MKIVTRVSEFSNTSKAEIQSYRNDFKTLIQGNYPQDERYERIKSVALRSIAAIAFVWGVISFYQILPAVFSFIGTTGWQAAKGTLLICLANDLYVSTKKEEKPAEEPKKVASVEAGKDSSPQETLPKQEKYVLKRVATNVFTWFQKEPKKEEVQG